MTDARSTHTTSAYAATIVDSEVAFINQPLSQPLVLSSGSIEELTEARAKVRLRVHGVEAVGQGSIYLSDLWAWPEPSLTHAQRDTKLRELCRAIAERLAELCGGEACHPMELGLRLHDAVCETETCADVAEGLPALARAMCLSPFDAAIHDAVGYAVRRSAFELYDENCAIASADGVFADSSSCVTAVRQLLRREPVRRLPAWLIVGKNDVLDRNVKPWISDRGYHHLKLKLMGIDAQADAQRTVDVYRQASQWSPHPPVLSVDTNEATPDADAVQAYLDYLRRRDAEAFDALAYLEQPTGRDISQHAFDWRAIGRLKPVLLDEGLTSLRQLELGRKQGWTGLALKTCKGHSFMLMAAAWARAHDMTLALQDLTNPGLALLHGALSAAFIPTVNGVELNSPQFTPDANTDWAARFPTLFEPRTGFHELPTHLPPGLGSRLLATPA